MKTYKTWSENEDKRLVELKEKFFTNEEIAQKLNRSKSSIRNRVSEIRIHTNIKTIVNKWSDSEVQELINLRSNNLKWSEIAIKLDRSEESCRGKFKRIS